MRSKWQKWRALSRREQWILVEATFEMHRTVLGLRRAGLPRAASRSFVGECPAPKIAHSGSAEDALAIARIVEMASAVGPLQPNCLQRSVTLWRILRRHGVGSEVRIGARANPESGPPQFHAWAEHNGIVLNDHPEIVAGFVPFGLRLKSGS